jgi:hypothetical protein
MRRRDHLHRPGTGFASDELGYDAEGDIAVRRDLVAEVQTT